MTLKSKTQCLLMNVQSVKFFLYSFFMHVALLWLLWQGGAIEYDTDPNMRSSGALFPVLAVRIVTGEMKTKPTATQLRANDAAVIDQKTMPGAKEVPNSAKQIPENRTSEGYFPTGLLTRLPSPLTDIDLNVTAIDEVAVEGAIELTILVDEDGKVTEVSTAVSQDNTRVFAGRVAALFQSTRFSPGEIKGKAVKSQLRITVVSEPSAESSMKQINSESVTLMH